MPYQQLYSPTPTSVAPPAAAVLLYILAPPPDGGFGFSYGRFAFGFWNELPPAHPPTHRSPPSHGAATAHSVKAGGCFKASGWGGAICDAMKPAEGDLVVEGKRGLCGFASTNLVSAGPEGWYWA